MFKKLLFTLALCFSVALLLGQNYRCLLYSNRQGLQNNLTKAAVQDNLGFVWVATDNGLARFDGLSFQAFSLGLPSPYIKALYKTKSGRLLASTDMGILEITSMLDSVQFKVFVKGSQETTDSTVRYPKLIFEDSKSNIWITDDMGMCKCKDGKFKKYTFNKKLTTFTYYRTFCVTESKEGTLFIFSQNGFTLYFDAQKDQFIEMTDIPKFEAVNFVYKLSNEHLLICSTDGIYELEIDTNKRKKSLVKLISNINASCLVETQRDGLVASTWDNGVHRLKQIDGKWTSEKLTRFPFERCNSMLVDNKDNIFVCTDAGIVMIEDNFFEMPVTVASQNYINCVGISKNMDTWFTDGNFAYRIKAGSKTCENKSANIKPRGQITIITPSNQDDDDFWLASSTSELYYIEKGKIKNYLDLKPVGRTIFFCSEDKAGNLWACMDGITGVVKISRDFKYRIYGKAEGIDRQMLVIRQNSDGKIFGGSLSDSTYLYEYLPAQDRFVNRSVKLNFVHNKDMGINDLCFQGEKVWLASNQGVLEYKNKTISQLQTGVYSDNMVRSITTDKSGALWFAIDKGIIKYVEGTAIMFDEENGLSTITAAYRSMAVDQSNHLWIGTSLGLNYAKNDESITRTNTPYITKINVNKQKVDLNIKHLKFTKESYLTIDYICFGFPASEISYQYRLQGEDDKWVDVQNKTELLLPSLPLGTHKLQIRAKLQGNFLWSYPCELTFVVLRPWYQTWWAYLIWAIVFALTVKWVVNYNTRRYRWANVRLEKMVKERTQELLIKNTDLEQKNEEILAQRDEIELQKNEIEKKSKHITSSIQYAQRIQFAVLSSNEAIENVFPDHFILFKPRDIVSGDFYYMKEIEGKLIIAAADCTGHGVPGGFMSILGTTLLNEIVHNTSSKDAAEILNQLRLQIKTSLQQTGKKGQQQDGMDVALCCIDLKDLSLEFAGANIPLYLYRKNNENLKYELTEIKGDRMPIGVHPHDNIGFKSHRFQLKKGDVFYLFSDGLISQFGGDKGHKFKSKKMQLMLNEIQHQPMVEQKRSIEKNLRAWKGNYDQVDDILILGVRI